MLRGKLIQTYQGLSASYQVADEFGERIASAEIPQNYMMGEIYYRRHQADKYRLHCNPLNGLGNIGKKAENKRFRMYQIFNSQGENCGHICLKEEKTGFFSGYSFHEVLLEGRIYHFYMIGRGKEGVKHPFFEVVTGEEIQIGLIEKPSVVYDMKDVYKYYIKDGRYLDAASLYILYQDYIKHGNKGAIPVHSKEVTYINTTNKELLKRYNPRFIEEE